MYRYSVVIELALV